MRKNDEMLDTFPCHEIDNEIFVPLVEGVLKKISVSIALIAGNKDFSIFIHKAGASQEEANQNNIKMKMAYIEGGPAYPKKVDIVGTILIQIIAANFNGGDYTNWCKYFLNKPEDEASKKIYEKVMAIDVFFRSVLTEEEYEKLIEDCKKGGLT